MIKSAGAVSILYSRLRKAFVFQVRAFAKHDIHVDMHIHVHVAKAKICWMHDVAFYHGLFQTSHNSHW